MSKFAKAFTDLNKIKSLTNDSELLESIQVAQQAISIIELMGYVKAEESKAEQNEIKRQAEYIELLENQLKSVIPYLDELEAVKLGLLQS